MKRVLIYQGKCVPADKSYIGSSLYWTRPNAHCYLLSRGIHVNLHLQNAWNMYGAEAFAWAVIDFCDEKDRRKVEQWWIEELKTADPRFGYNMQPLVRTLPSRSMMAEIHKKTWAESPERKKAASDRLAALWQDEDYSATFQAVLDENRHKSYLHWLTPEGRKLRAKLSSEYWAAHREDKLKQLAEARTAFNKRCEEQDYRSNHGQLVKAGRTPEVNARHSATLKKQWATNPELRAKRLAGMLRENARRHEEALAKYPVKR